MKWQAGWRRGAAIGLCIGASACAPAPGKSVNAAGAYGPFLAARYADAQGDPATATQYYVKALGADPANGTLKAEGFLAAVLAGSPAAVSLAAADDNNVLASLLLGNDAALKGNFAAARGIYATLPQDQLAGLMKPILIAWTQYGAGNATAALATLSAHFSDPSLGPVYVLNAALIADLAGDAKNAAAYYADAGGSAANLRQAQMLMSWQIRHGQPALAAPILAQLAAMHPDLALAIPALQRHMGDPVIGSATDGLAETYLTFAASLNQQSQSLLRITFLRYALMLRPDLTAARLLLAAMQAGAALPPGAPVAVAQLQAALATLQAVKPDDPLYGPVAMQEAGLLAQLNRPDEAVRLLDAVAAGNPGNPQPVAAAADVLRTTNQCPAAIGDYNRAIGEIGAPGPGAWTLYFDRAICEDEGGDWHAAEPDLTTALSLSPNQPYVLNYLAYSWAMRHEKLGQAADMLQQAMGLDPNDGAVIDSLGYVKLLQGDKDTALRLLTKAVELSPTDAEVNAHLGDAFWQAGMKLQGTYQWRRALSLGPDDKLKAELKRKLSGTAGTTGNG